MSAESRRSRSDAKANGAAKKPPSRSEAALARFHEEGDLKTYDAKNLLRLWPYVKPQQGRLYLSLGLLMIGSVLALLRPLVMRRGFDEMGSDPSAIFHAGLLLTAIIVVEQAISFPQMYLMQLAGARAMAELRRVVFDFLHTRSLKFFDRTPVGRLVTRVTNDVDAINEMFASGALNAFGDLVRLAVIVVVMVSLDWQMSLIAFAALPPVFLLVNWTRRRIRDAFRQVRAKTARMNAYLNEQVSGMALVQAYAREATSAVEFDTINDAYREANNRSIVFDATLDAAIELVSSLCIASILWFAGVHTLSDRVSFGTLFAFVAYLDMFFMPIRDLSTRYTLLQSAMTGAERVFELLDNKEEDAPSTGGTETREARAASEDATSDAALELDKVTFAYKAGSPVLHDVSFAVKRGEKVALVGATGSGKSTAVSLALRLYDVEEGAVRVFGRDVKAWSRDALRSKFALVPQDVFLFPGTVATNIAAGDEEPDIDRVIKALTNLDALEVFTSRDGGLEAKVIERGANFSAGERQLLAFARALYKNPDILILDEATANVDSNTEARLQLAVERVLEGRTALVIAHRLSTIRAADRIVVFHKGRIAEQGTHDELMILGGVYARLHELQFTRNKLLEEVPEAAPPA